MSDTGQLPFSFWASLPEHDGARALSDEAASRVLDCRAITHIRRKYAESQRKLFERKQLTFDFKCDTLKKSRR